MLVKVCNQIVQAVPLTSKTASMHEKKIIPVDSEGMRYLRFRAIGNFEVDGANGNWDSFPYNWLEDDEPGYGYKSFIGKFAHLEHNSTLGIAGSIGDLPDAYLNKFIYPDDVPEKKWASILDRKYDEKRSSILSMPGQKDGAIEVLMRIDTNLVKSAKVDKKVRGLLDRIIRMIDTGHKLTCSMGCFLDGTPILMSNGLYKPIELVRNGEFVITHTGEVRNVTETMIRNYDGLIYKLNVLGQQKPLALTPEHPVLVRKGKPLCACGCGTRVLTKNGMWISGHHQNVFNSNPKMKMSGEEKERLLKEIEDKQNLQLEWLEARDLEVGDYVAYPLTTNVVESSNITIGKARLIGYFLAEGSYIKHTNTEEETYKSGVAFSFGNTEKDRIFVTEVIQLLKSEFGLEARAYESAKYRETYVNDKGETAQSVGCMEIRVNSRDVAKFFEYYCGEYAKTKRLPDEALSWDLEIQKNIIGAFYNGDGCCADKSNDGDRISTEVYASTISEILAYQISFMLKRCKIPSVLYSSHYVYQLNRVYLIYIRTQWQSLMTEYWSYDTSFKHENNTSYKILNNFILFPIRGITKEDYKGPVYNLEVEEDHSYVAGGMAVHNCNIQYSVCSTCGNTSHFSSQYCNHLKPGHKGGLTIVSANDIRDLLDKELLRPEWLKHLVASKFDVDEVLRGSSRKGVAVRNAEINHKTSFFELSVVATPAFFRADQLEKLARAQTEDRKEYLARIRREVGDDALLEIYPLLQEEGRISSLCELG
jgi:hypothetical protein